MPIYSIQGPDGKIYEIEGPPGATKAQVVAAIQAKMQASAPAPATVPMPVVEPAKKEGFGAAFGKGIESILSPSKTAIGALTGSAEEAALAGLKRSEASPYADQVSLDKVKAALDRGLLPAAGEVLRQIPLAITEQAPNIAATLGSAKAGSLLGAKLGTAIAPGVGTAVGTIGGGIVGAVAPSLLQQFGGNIQRQAQEQLAAKQPVDISRTAAAAAAGPQAALDVAATFIPMGRTVAGAVLGPQVKQLLERGAKEGAEKLARESLPTVLAKGAGISIATEAPTEAIQSMLERAQAGLPLLSDDALKEYGEAAYQASLIAPIGSAARVGERSTARQQTLPPENRPGETDRQAAERIQAEILAMKQAQQPPAPPGPILSTNNLYNLIAQPNGYGLVEQYKQRLLALPEQTPEIKQAIEDAAFIQRRSVIESQERKTRKPAPEEGKDAGTTVTTPSGEGTEVAGKPGAKRAAEGTGATQPSGVVPAVPPVAEPPVGEGQQPASVAPEVKALQGAETRLILPDGEKRSAKWEVIEADSVSAALVEGRAQPRDRQRAASNAQVKSIANNPDFDRLSDTSQTMDYGAPTLTGEYVIVGGNGRFEGVNLSYDTEAGQAYKQNLISNAQRFGLDPAQVSGMKKPVLIRKIPSESAKPDDTRKLAIQSNIVAGLEMSDMERAALDSERMTNLNQLDITETGDIPLTTKNMGTIRDALRGYTKEELSGMLAADGSLSQSGLRRVKNAVLYKAYGKTDTLSRLLESPDADLKNVGTALMRASGSMSSLMDGIRSNAIPADYDIIADLTGAVETLSALRASGTKVQDFISQSDMFGGGISNEAKTILTFLDQNLRSAKSITEFLNDYASAAISAESAGDGLFGEVQLPSKQETIERAAQRPEAERAAAKSQQTIFEQPAGAPAEEGAAKPEGEGRPLEGGEGAVAKPSLVEMRKRYEAGRAAPAPVETPPEKTELDKEIEAKIEELGRVLSRIMGKFGLKDVALKLVEDMKAEGEYAQSVVRLALDAASPVQALRHESIHALKELGFFSPQQWKALEKQAKSKWIDQYLKNVNVNKEPLGEGEKSRYDAYMDLYKGDMDAIIEEAIADAFGDFDVNKAPPGMMQAILNRLRNFFDAVKTAFGGEVTAEQVFRKVEKGELKAEAAPATEGEAKPSLRAPKTEAFERWSGGAPVVGLRQDHVFVSGKPVVVEALHGTTNADIAEFKKSQANIESDFGAGFYASNTPADVAINYANVEGADLTRRIETLAERIADNEEFEGDMDAAMDEARKRLSQGAPNTMKLYMLFKNPAVLGGKGETFFDYTQSYNEETDEYGEPTGSLVDFVNQLDEIGEGLDISMMNVERAKQDLIEAGRDNEGLKFSELAQIVKDRFSDTYDLDGGSAANGEVLRQALEGMGFDGVIDTNAYAKFGPRMIRGAYSMIKTEGMAGLDKDTVHFVAFKPTQIKSATGNIGTFDKTKPDIRYSLRVMRGEEVPNLGKKVTVDMVGKYFDDQFIKEFGGKLDYNNPQHFDRAVQQATEEVQYQIKNDKSGLDWYEEDIQKAFKDTAKILPELKKKDNRILFSVIAGIMSPQTIARDNWFIAAKAFEHYVKTGDIPGINPENGNLWMGGTQSANKKVQLEFLDRMVKDLGQKNAIKWMMTPHPVSEINEFRSKYGNIKSGIDGKATDIKPGLYAFGPKIGPFVSNINGIHDVTVDKWFTRTFNRYFGTMIGPDGKIIDAPTEPQRRFIKELANKVAGNAGIKNYQVQSLLWFYEQRLFTELGAQSPSYGFSDGAVKFLESRGKGGGAGVAVLAGPTGAGGVKPAAKKQPKYSLRDSLGLYSELENKVAQGPNKAPAASWKAYINGLTQKGVKPEEIEWSGVRDWLDLQTGPVSKDAVTAYLKQGGVKVEEVVLGEKGRREAKILAAQDIAESIQSGLGEFSDDARDMLDRWRSAEDGSKLERQSASSLEEMLREAGDNRSIEEFVDSGAAQTDSTKYGQYVLPGGKSYREVLLTLPNTPSGRFEVVESGDGRYRIKNPDGTVDQQRYWTDRESAEAWRKSDEKESGIKYKSSHWSQPNVLAHIRLNDRTDADGKKVLFVEEIQSDWGQEGKKSGFKGQKGDPLSESEYKRALELQRLSRETSLSDQDRTELDALMARHTRAYDALMVPAAPFVTKTEGWLNLSLKRVMVMAAEGGYDKVAFVTGAQSAARFDLSKQVESISYQDNKDGTYRLVAAALGRGIAIPEQTVERNKLPDVVGKEVADKIISGEGTAFPKGSVSEGMKKLSGLDLKVGGKGMKTFYDQIVPLAVKKLLPKVGGGQMGDVNLLKDSMKKYDKELMKDDLKALGEEGFRAKYAHDQQPGFDVTPEMKQKVETTGLPRFSLRSTTPVDIRNRVLQTTVARDEKTFVQRITEAISPTSYSSFRAAALNRYNQLGVYDRKLAEQMKRAGGAALLASNSAEAAALLSDLGAGLTASALGVHDRMGGVPVYRNGITIISNKNNTVKGPTAIFAPLAKFGDPVVYQEYQFWAGVKRGSRFLADGREELFEPADIQRAERLRKQYLKDGVDFEAIQKEWIKYNNGLVDYGVATGVLSKERAEIYKKHSDYLPFYRQMDGVETVGPKVFQAISGVKPPKKLKGSEAPLDDFLENIVRNTQSMIQMGVKNVAAQRAADVASKIGMVTRLNYQANGPTDFQVYENGKVVSYNSSDILFVNAIKSLGLPELPFIGFLSGPANLLRNLVTKDPGFMLANLMRDSMSAWVTSGVKMTPMVDTISNFGSALAGKDPVFQALMNAGILGGYEFSQNVEQSGREFGKALRKQAGAKATGYKGILEMGAKPFTSLWEALEKGTTASDAATRMEVYKKTLAETGNEAEALYRALEVMNFNRKGSSAVVRILTAAVPFLNARMQGLDVLYRASTGKMNAADAKEVQKRFFVRGATIMALSAAYWVLTHDDDEYKKQEQETRDNYWLLPSMGVKIPIPFEIGVLFKVIPERILAYTFGSDTGEDFLKSMGRQLTSTLAFNPIPQTALPVVEAMTNFSFFTMRPIVGQGLEGVQPAYQVGPGTSRLAEKIGAATKGLPTELQISPMKFDQLINGYTGTMGMYLVNLMDAVYDMNTDSPKPSMRFERMPLIRRFALDPEARGSVTAYYELKNSVDAIVRTSNMLERTMNYQELPGYLQDNMKMLAAQDYLLDLEKTMKEFREMKVMIRSSQMEADAKRDAILSIDQMENQLTANIQYLKSLAKGG
jgi:hypothetical protein